MFINELPQNLVKILAKDETFAKLLDSVKGIKVGQSIEGKVAEVLSGGKVLLDLNGQRVSAETSGNLVKGQSIQAKVETVSPSVILKVSPENSKSETIAKNIAQKTSHSENQMERGNRQQTGESFQIKNLSRFILSSSNRDDHQWDD